MKRFFILILISVFFLISIPVKAEDSHPLLNNIVSDAAIVTDSDTGQILDEKNADEKIYPASMTKMMTAILAIEKSDDLNQTIPITSDMLTGLAERNASLVGFQPGDTPTVEDLLYGIALVSGADACNAVSYALTDHNPDAFVDLMNEKAKKIGMTSTHFANCTGLHDDNHYSTVRDIALLLKYCIRNETFRTVFSSRSHTTSHLASAPDGIYLYSTMWQAASAYGNTMDGLIGGKTGYTEHAGHCLASWSEVNGMHLIEVTAHADTPSYQMTHLQDTDVILNNLKSWSSKTMVRKNEKLSSIQVVHPLRKETIPVKAPETVRLDLPENTNSSINCTVSRQIFVSNHPQKPECTLTIRADNHVIYRQKLQITVPAETDYFEKMIIWIADLFR